MFWESEPGLWARYDVAQEHAFRDLLEDFSRVECADGVLTMDDMTRAIKALEQRTTRLPPEYN